MRRPLLGWLGGLVVALMVQATPAHAQIGGYGVGADPFSFYYGYYLPHQAAQAAQPRTIDTINQVVANQQYSARTDRASLYDPISPYGEDEIDPFKPYAPGSGRDRTARPTATGYGNTNSNVNGNGPGMYYNRAARYFPTLKTGRGPNHNLATLRARGSGGMGMPAAPSMPSFGGR